MYISYKVLCILYVLGHVSRVIWEYTKYMKYEHET